VGQKNSEVTGGFSSFKFGLETFYASQRLPKAKYRQPDG